MLQLSDIAASPYLPTSWGDLGTGEARSIKANLCHQTSSFSADKGIVGDANGENVLK